MSLGSLGNNLNRQAGNIYSVQRERIMREAKEMESRKMAIEKDNITKEISHLRLKKQTLEGRIVQLNSEILKEKDPRMRSSKQSELHRIMGEQVHIQGEIAVKQGRVNAASNIRYGNPHYF